MSSFAVIDVETTGLNPYRHHRIVEIAVLVMRPDGTRLREFVSLINPERDLGPTSIHGLTAIDILPAPRFSELAGTLIETLDGCVALAGHNVRFDHSFLAVEFERLGHAFPEVPTLCTLELAGGGTLSRACSAYNIAPPGQAHTALDDARATAELLITLLSHAPLKLKELSRLPAIVWPRILKSPVDPVTRDLARQRQVEPPTYLQRLLARSQDAFPPNTGDSAVLAYTAILDRVLEDRRVDEAEGEDLIEFATRWDIDGTRIREVHRDYLNHLAVAALADGVVTDSERRDLSLVAHLLGVEHRCLDEMLDGAAEKIAEFSSPGGDMLPGRQQLVGKRVCFTGECQCKLGGETITREKAAELAERRGMIVMGSVTKKLDLLVVADPYTLSTKARKARKYGIRVIHEPLFWKGLGVEVD